MIKDTVTPVPFNSGASIQFSTFNSIQVYSLQRMNSAQLDLIVSLSVHIEAEHDIASQRFIHHLCAPHSTELSRHHVKRIQTPVTTAKPLKTGKKSSPP